MKKTGKKPRRPSPKITRAAAATVPDLSHIVEPLRGFAVPTSSLIFDPENARLHPEQHVAKLMTALTTFGQDELLIFHPEGRRVRHGNGRLMAARQLMLQGDLRWSMIAAYGLAESEEQSIARGLAHNITPEDGGWNHDVLAQLTKRIIDAKIDPKATGMGDDQIARLLARIDPKTSAPKPPASTKRFSVDVPVADWPRLLALLETFDADRSKAFMQWLGQSIKRSRR